MQIVDELFVRSHQFRMLVVSDLQEFLELTLGTDHRRPLPPPREVAQRLRQAATRAVQGWHERFGAAYKKLALGHHFLRHTQQVCGPWHAVLVGSLGWCLGCWARFVGYQQAEVWGLPKWEGRFGRKSINSHLGVGGAEPVGLVSTVYK